MERPPSAPSAIGRGTLLGARTVRRRSWSQDEAQIAVVAIIGGKAHRGAQQFTQANDCRDVRTLTARQKRAIGRVLEIRCVLARNLANAQQEVDFAQAEGWARLGLRAAALITRDQIAAPRRKLRKPTI